MAQLQLSEADARKFYPTASADLKTIFEQTFGLAALKQDITEVIQNWNDILQYEGVTNSILPYSNPITKLEKSVNAFVKLCLIAKVYNEGTILDWENSNIYKYFAYKYKSGGSWVPESDGWSSSHGSPGGLYYKSNALCDDALVKFKDIFDDYYM